MKNFLRFLSKNRLFTLLLLIIYYMLVVLLHEEVSDLFISSVESVPRKVYQLVLLSIGLLCLIIYICIIIRNIVNSSWKKEIIYYFVITLFLVVLSFMIIIIHNIEIIHFAQYAGLTILLFPLTGRYRDTVVMATILGFLDEAYQYLVLRPDGTDYFDFNDVILNIIGIGLGLILIFSNGFPVFRGELRKWYRSLPNIAITLFVILICVLFLSSVMHLYPSDNGAQYSFVLVKVKESGFWKEVNSIIGRFHVVRPWEGTIIIALLMMFYSSMDWVSIKIMSKKL